MGANFNQMAYLFTMNPSNRIRELRKSAGLSQSELAAYAGISQPAISQLGNDTRSLTLDWMRTIVHILGVLPADLPGNEDNPYRLSSEEQLLLDHFRAADPAQRALIERVAEPLADFRGPDPQSDRLRLA